MPDFRGSLDLLRHTRHLIMNGLRNKVIIETDGKLMSGRDVAMAAATWCRRIWICYCSADYNGLRYDESL